MGEDGTPPYRDFRKGEDLPEEEVAMALDLCERWRAEQERCASMLRGGSPRDSGPSRSRSRSRSPNSCRSSVCRVVTRGGGTD